MVEPDTDSQHVTDNRAINSVTPTCSHWKCEAVGLENVESRLDVVESRLDNVESGLENVFSRLDDVESRLENVESRLDDGEIKTITTGPSAQPNTDIQQNNLLTASQVCDAGIGNAKQDINHISMVTADENKCDENIMQGVKRKDGYQLCNLNHDSVSTKTQSQVFTENIPSLENKITSPGLQQPVSSICVSEDLHSMSVSQLYEKTSRDVESSGVADNFGDATKEQYDNYTALQASVTRLQNLEISDMQGTDNDVRENDVMQEWSVECVDTTEQSSHANRVDCVTCDTDCTDSAELPHELSDLQQVTVTCSCHGKSIHGEKNNTERMRPTALSHDLFDSQQVTYAGDFHGTCIHGETNNTEEIDPAELSQDLLGLHQVTVAVDFHGNSVHGETNNTEETEEIDPAELSQDLLGLHQVTVAVDFHGNSVHGETNNTERRDPAELSRDLFNSHEVTAADDIYGNSIHGEMKDAESQISHELLNLQHVKVTGGCHGDCIQGEQATSGSHDNKDVLSCHGGTDLFLCSDIESIKTGNHAIDNLGNHGDIETGCHGDNTDVALAKSDGTSQCDVHVMSGAESSAGAGLPHVTNDTTSHDTQSHSHKADTMLCLQYSSLDAHHHSKRGFLSRSEVSDLDTGLPQAGVDLDDLSDSHTKVTPNISSDKTVDNTLGPPGDKTAENPSGPHDTVIYTGPQWNSGTVGSGEVKEQCSDSVELNTHILKDGKTKSDATAAPTYQMDSNTEGSRISSDVTISDVTARTMKEELQNNGYSSHGVKLRRHASAPDGGSRPQSPDVARRGVHCSPDVSRRAIQNSPLMRVRGIVIDDMTDSDSPRSEDSDDDDDDAGIYAESYRMSRWLYLGDSDLSHLADVGSVCSSNSALSVAETTSSGTSDSLCDLVDLEPCNKDLDTQAERKKSHKRSDSISTTVSEVEFRSKYKTNTRRVVQRKSSTQLYQRISEKYLDEGRTVHIEKSDSDGSFGLHIADSRPVVVSTVEEGSPAQRAGLRVGDVLISVNEVNVLEASHHEVVKLMAADCERVKLCVIADRLPADAPLWSGYLTKQGGSGLLKNWRRRWFILKQDHCLYYYKTQEDKDPLGAILLNNYSITKAPEVNRKHVFKATKFGQRTYYFQADSEEDMTCWASAMAASANVTNKKDTWLDVSSHNVGLPALSIKQPDCHGYLTKMGNRRKTWKRRYCVLKDACLYYYVDVTSSTAQGVAHLHGYTVEESMPYNKKHGFMVVPPDKNLRTFYFSADHMTDKKRWMEALQKSIGRWIRADQN